MESRGAGTLEKVVPRALGVATVWDTPCRPGPGLARDEGQPGGWYSRWIHQSSAQNVWTPSNLSPAGARGSCDNSFSLLSSFLV